MKILGMDPDALYSFVLGILAQVAKLFIGDAHVSAILDEVTKLTVLFGGVFHLDGQASFKLDPDTIFALVVALIANLMSVFQSDAKIMEILNYGSNIATVIGMVFHLDGHIVTKAPPTTT